MNGMSSSRVRSAPSAAAANSLLVTKWRITGQKRTNDLNALERVDPQLHVLVLELVDEQRHLVKVLRIYTQQRLN